MKREETISKLRRILEPLVREYSIIGYFGNHESCHGPNISWFEMFCRSSYGIIAYTKATCDSTFLVAFSKTLLRVIEDKRYINFNDYDQKAVELVPVATLLLIFKEKTWDTYSTEQRLALTAYFEKINEIQLCSNNWIFFRILVCSILEKLTGKDYSKIIAEGWRFVDKCYQEEGWYRDGLYGTEDYYNAFGFHFYSLLYYYLFDDEKRKRIIKERTLLFAKQYKYFFDDEGRCIPYGRSLIYRYATISFWSMMLVNNLLDDESANEAELIIRNNFQWWARQHVYDEDGYQCLGYAYPNREMLEAYNSAGSVYWSLKAFMVLLADEHSGLWEEKKSHKDNAEYKTHRLANGNIIISLTPCGNIAYINSYHGSGQRQDFAKYMHFAYHSALGFNIERSVDDFKFLSDDSSLVFDVNGVKVVRKKNILYKNIGNFIQEFVWGATDAIKVTTTLIALGEFHIRIHEIKSNTNCTCYETGFAISSGETQIIGEKEHYSYVANSQHNSCIYRVNGEGFPKVIHNEKNSNIYYEETLMPAIACTIKKGRNVLVDVIGLIESCHDQNYILNYIKSNIMLEKDQVNICKDSQVFTIDLKKQNLLLVKACYVDFCEKTNSLVRRLGSHIKQIIKKLNH